MQHLDAADYVVIGAFFIAFFALLAWVVIYAVTTRGDWRLTREGRHLMAFRGSLVLFMAMGVVNGLWTSYPCRDIVRVAVVSMFAVSVLDGVRVLILAQTARRKASMDRIVQLHAGVTDEGGGSEVPAVQVTDR